MGPIKLERVASLFSEGIEHLPPSRAERRRRQALLLCETPAARLRRVCASLRSFGRPAVVLDAVRAAHLLIRDALVGVCGLPDPRAALVRPEGLCGLARRPTPAQALEAYASGLALHAPIGPACWWAPSRRWVARPGAAGSAQDTLVRLRASGLSVELDGEFEPLLSACSGADRARRRSGFGGKLMRIYSDLADEGLVHSLALRSATGELVAGAFGLAIGRVFTTESVFGPDELARSVLVLLDRELAVRNFTLHEARLGATPGAAPAAAFACFGFAPITPAQFVAAANEHLPALRVQRWRPLAAPGPDKREAKLARRRPFYAATRSSPAT